MHDHHAEEVSGGRLLVTLILNLVITAAEIVGGIISGSLSLVSDALHNLSDAVAVVISYAAIRLSTRENTARHTFGLKRAEILAAVVNSTVLVMVSFYLFYHAVLRLLQPESIQGSVMVVVAGLGLVANVGATLLLRRDSHNNMNIRSTYLHLLSDAVSSVGVIVGGVAIVLWKIYWIDPLLTIAIGLYILKESFAILKEAIHVLMEGAPADVSPQEIQREVEAVSGVLNVHHLHIWSIGEHDVHVEAHLAVADMLVSATDVLKDQIRDLLTNKFHITHVTLQMESECCADDALIKRRAT